MRNKEKQIENPNKVIAKFMESSNPLGEPAYWTASHTEYDSDWGALMPVIDKIAGLGYQYEIKNRFFDIEDLEPSELLKLTIIDKKKAMDFVVQIFHVQSKSHRAASSIKAVHAAVLEFILTH